MAAGAYGSPGQGWVGTTGQGVGLGAQGPGAGGLRDARSPRALQAGLEGAALP